jgi:single-strand DNA-binding protein
MSVRSLNKVMLIGNLTRDPELRYTPAGTAVVTIGLATNRAWTTESGEKKEETEFHRIVAWNKLAELCSQLLTKGRKIYVEGRLQTRSWTGQDGNQRQSTEIVIDDMIILDSRRPETMGVATLPVSPFNQPVKTILVPAANVVEDTSSKTKAVKKTEVKTEEKAQPKTEAENKTEDISPDDIPF